MPIPEGQITTSQIWNPQEEEKEKPKDKDKKEE